MSVCRVWGRLRHATCLKEPHRVTGTCRQYPLCRSGVCSNRGFQCRLAMVRCDVCLLAAYGVTGGLAVKLHGGPAEFGSTRFDDGISSTAMWACGVSSCNMLMAQPCTVRRCDWYCTGCSLGGSNMGEECRQHQLGCIITLVTVWQKGPYRSAQVSSMIQAEHRAQ